MVAKMLANTKVLLRWLQLIAYALNLRFAANSIDPVNASLYDGFVKKI